VPSSVAQASGKIVMSIDPDTIAFAHKLAVSRDLFYQSNIAKISSGRCYTPAYPEPYEI